MKLPLLRIGELTAKVPIIQGGMGIGVSRSKLSSAVARRGGIGVISGVQIGFDEADFERDPKNANLRALKREIKLAKEMSCGGIIGVNLMVAMSNYDEYVNVCVEEKADLIISGAGLPTSLPSLVKNTSTKAVPIVSSSKAVAVILKLWDRRYQYLPDMVIVEGPEAGGHLGFHEIELEEGNKRDLHEIVKDVLEAVKPFEEKYGKKISVIAAGGIYTGEDIAGYLKCGAAGVQMATRFVATHECDADIKYKKAYIDSQKEQIQIIKSPVGLPGRAIRNKFIEEVTNGKRPIVEKCYKCLKNCNPSTAPYCISKALINAVKGNIDEGLIFTGSSAYKLQCIVSVKELIDELVSEAEKIY